MNIFVSLCLTLLSIFACEHNSTNEMLTGEVIPPGIDLKAATQAKDIVGGAMHMCVHLDNDTIKCWGSNQDGQLNLKAARNVSKKLYDVTNARFSKISAGGLHTCGILKDAPFEGIAICFGKEGEWLDVPHEKVKDISVGGAITCFIKNDESLACVGPIISVFSNISFSSFNIKADSIIKYGISPISGAENQDFSQMKFKNLKTGIGRVCAQAVKDEIVYCMGGNLRKSGQSIDKPVLDYAAGDETTSILILRDGKLNFIGDVLGFINVNNIAHPEAMKYKKIFTSLLGEGLLLAAGNKYDNGSPIPENTLITFSGLLEDGVLGIAFAESSYEVNRFRVICMLKDNHKVKCEKYYTTSIINQTNLIDDIPKEIAY